MNTRETKIPGPDHPITIEQAGKTWRAIYKGQTIAESTDVLVMQEAAYPPVAYFPRGDVHMDNLSSTEHHTYCPYKGEASYFSLHAGNATEENAVWTYQQPHDAVASIRGRLAFYAVTIDAVEEV